MSSRTIKPSTGSLQFAGRLLFPVEVRKSTKGNFCCCIPEASCAVTGESVEELLRHAHDIIADHLEDLQADKLPFLIPQFKCPVKDEGFVAVKAIQVALPQDSTPSVT